MSNEFEFVFEELPLIVERGFEAGLVNGAATIRFANDGEWFVRELSLDGTRLIEAPAGIEHREVAVDLASYSWLYLTIMDQLENGRFRDQIEAKIYELLADAGIPQQRDDRAEHSTLNRAQQGV